jgi:hypothetical protein
VLDAFMDEKGTCSPEQWREFCNDAVILAEFDGFNLESGEEFTADLRITSFRPNGIEGKKFTCELTCECGTVIAKTEGNVPENGENYLSLGSLTAKIPDVDKPVSLTLSLNVEGTDVKNHYKLMAYPKRENVDFDGAFVFDSVNAEAESLLRDGKTVLILPDLDGIEKSIEGFYCQDFWCYPMFSQISRMMEKPEPVGTMGLLIDTAHPSLADFPSEKYSTPQWWDIVMNSRSEIIDDCADGKHVIVRTIDNFERNHNLALVYEYNYLDGKVLVCNCDFEKIAQSPEGRQFIYSVVEYVKRENSDKENV